MQPDLHQHSAQFGQSSQPSLPSITNQDTILVVDDNPTNLVVLCDLLDSNNYQVAVAQDGETGMARAAETLPELILLDVMMPPGIDGFETCIRLKANPKTKHIPILFMTALSDTVNKVRGLELGAVDYITKPFNHAETLARINVHLSLRKAQANLIQKEKAAAIGHLVAGIAHEINNPVSFIHGNLRPAQDYAESLLTLISLYQQHTDAPSVVSDYAEDVDFPFIQKDLVKLLGSMQSGTERIRDIVTALRTFSCLDESDYKAVDLHAGIESALVLLQHRLRSSSGGAMPSQPDRPEIRLVKEYGTLPMFSCYASKINDAFLNLLTNAIDAMDEKCRHLPAAQHLSTPLVLTIETAVSDEQIVVTIADTGVGIPKENYPMLFDQFFTTKPVGEGMGLGLAVAQAVVSEDHGGQLTFSSEVGKGSVFTVMLPIQKS